MQFYTLNRLITTDSNYNVRKTTILIINIFKRLNISLKNKLKKVVFNS